MYPKTQGDSPSEEHSLVCQTGNYKLLTPRQTTADTTTISARGKWPDSPPFKHCASAKLFFSLCIPQSGLALLSLMGGRVQMHKGAAARRSHGLTGI